MKNIVIVILLLGSLSVKSQDTTGRVPHDGILIMGWNPDSSYNYNLKQKYGYEFDTLVLHSYKPKRIVSKTFRKKCK